MVFLLVFFYAFFSLFSCNNFAAYTLENYKFIPQKNKYILDIPYSPSISEVIASSNGHIGFDKYQNRIFFRGTIKQTDYSAMSRALQNSIEREALDNLFSNSKLEARYIPADQYIDGAFAMLMIPVLATPMAMEGISFLFLINGISKKEIVSEVISTSNYTIVKIVDNKKNNFVQPLLLVNTGLLLVNANPLISFVVNFITLSYSWNTKSPSEIFAEKAFPCSTFDNALYESSFHSKTLWLKFKLAGYYNENDQLNDKFFQDYKDKKLLIPEKFKPYEAGIYEAFDTYLKENAEKFSTPNINPAAQRQPLSAILPQSK